MAYTVINPNQLSAIQYATPTTGQTVAVNAGGKISLVLDPAGTLATLTVSFPSSPSNGDSVTIATSQIVTALTLSNGTFVGAISTLGVAGFASYIYSSSVSKWFRIA